MSRDSRRLPAPAPVPLSRLYSLEALLVMRDEAARRVVYYNRQADKLLNLKPLKLPKRHEAAPAVPDVEQRAVRPAMVRSTLIGY
jgi:hypothetical protein